MAFKVIAGCVALCFVLGVAFCALLSLSLVVVQDRAGNSDYLLAYLGHVVWFTLYQALLSTLGAVFGGVAVARALDHLRNFPGRKILIRGLILPLVLPELVAVLGLIAVWGSNGWISQLLAGWGLSSLKVYGLSGILLGHVFLNIPLVAVMMLAALEGAPVESRRLAAQIGLRGWSHFCLIEWPAIRSRLPGAASLVFMLCVTSFTVALVMGGGPGATTIEVAIYQSLRFDFDPQRAVLLALMQIGLCGTLFLAIGGGSRPLAVLPSLGGRGNSWSGYHHGTAFSFAADVTTLAAAGAFLLAPMIAVVLSGVGSVTPVLAGESTLFWQAMLTSLSMAACASTLALGLAWALATARNALLSRPRSPSWLARRLAYTATTSGTLILVMPPIVLASGWFVLLHQLALSRLMAPVVVVTINALMALPFVLQLLLPALAEAASCHDRLCMNLGLAGWRRLYLIDWPVLSRSLALAAALAAAWSLGDLGAIALFASQDLVTLPSLLYRNLGSYRTGEAAGVALMLTVLCLGLLTLASSEAAERLPSKSTKSTRRWPAGGWSSH